jgi:uncharacterized LabA/DUF88 family protein
MSNSLRANIYIDGFNFYYCAVRGTNFKWIDLSKLCNILFPLVSIQKIYYFTAKVKASKHDPNAPTRQEIYWRALDTIHNLNRIEGNFSRWPKVMPQFPLAYIHDDYSKPPNMVQVERTEEKGSDVNLAAMLLYDSSINNADEYIVISNDSDLALAIEIAVSKMNRTVVVVNPNRTSNANKFKNCRLSLTLRKVATRSYNSINDKVLSKSLFRTILTDSVGQFRKPATW